MSCEGMRLRITPQSADGTIRLVLLQTLKGEKHVLPPFISLRVHPSAPWQKQERQWEVFRLRRFIQKINNGGKGAAGE